MADSILMKEINKDIVRRQLKLARAATKPELAIKTGLSVVTVNSLIAEMVESGEVLQGECIPSNGGRPSTQYIFNKNYSYAAIIYGHQENNHNLIQMLVVNLYGETVEKKRDYVSNVTVECFDPWLEEVFRKYQKVCLIAFGLPGAEENQIITLNDYPEIIGDAFLKHYREKFKVPVIFENDVNASASGYYFRHGDPLQQTMVGIYFPRIYAPGAGVVIRGEIYHGAKNFAGEFTFLPMPYPWQKLDYSNIGQVKENLGHLLAMYCCILAPDQLILYGDFWTDRLKAEIIEYTRKLLQDKFQPWITFSEEFDRDFEMGMMKLALDHLENQYRKGRDSI